MCPLFCYLEDELELQIGTIKRGARSKKYSWQACEDCGRTRWVAVVGGKPIYRVCKRCAGNKVGNSTRGRDIPGGRVGFIKISTVI